MAASWAASLPQSTIDSMLHLGILTMSLSPYRNESMHTIVNSIVSPPKGPVNTTFLNHLGAEMKRLAGADEDPLTALTVLKIYLDGVDNGGESRPWPWISDTVWLSLSGIFIALRLFARRWVTGSIRRDDWAITVSWLFVLTLGLFSIIYVTSSPIDGGIPCLHIWEQSWLGFTRNVRRVFLIEIFYIFSITSVKVSIMIFFWDLIPHDGTIQFRIFHKGIIIAGFLCVAAGTSAIFTAIFQCAPVNFWDDPLNAKCIPRLLVLDILSWSLFATDVVVLILPIQIILTMNMRMRDKVIVCGVFVVGGLACLASVPRILTTAQFLNDPDMTHKECRTGMWAYAESCLAIITSCLPATKSLAVHVAQKYVVQQGTVRVQNSFFRSKSRKARSLVARRQRRDIDLESTGIQSIYMAPPSIREKEAASETTLTNLHSAPSTFPPESSTTSLTRNDTGFTDGSNDLDKIPEDVVVEESKLDEIKLEEGKVNV